MKKVNIKILEDRTDTGGFGVEGYKVELTTNIDSIEAFISMRGFVSTSSGVFLHGLFDNPPYKSEFVDKVNKSIQEGFKNWKPFIEQVTVNLAEPE